MRESVIGLMGSAMVFFVFGVHMILRARRLRRKVERGFEKWGAVYRFFCFGDWILRYPRAHIAGIRAGGFFLVAVAVVLAVLAFSAR